MGKIFNDFSEIEQDVAKNAPAVVFKYRSWKDKNHKNVLDMGQLWFSHPFGLNDPLDVRPETEFDENEIRDKRYLDKLRNSAKVRFPDLNDVDREAKVQEQWAYTIGNMQHLVDFCINWDMVESNFDNYGIFSTSKDELVEKTWEEYGDNHQGYCIGFKTLELCKGLKGGFGKVDYSDEKYKYSFFKEPEENAVDELYYKKKSWEYEQEFRFITLGVGLYTERIQTFSVDTVSEIILGYNISMDDEKEILEIVNTKYPGNLPVYKTSRDSEGRLIKNRIR